VTTGTHRSWQRPDLVPLSLRLRFLNVVRVSAVALTIGLDLALQQGRATGTLAAIGAVGLVLGALADRILRRDNTRRWVLGVVLLGDALLISASIHLVGGLASPARYLVVLHLIVVALVGSHRTGLKLVVWYSLLILVAAEAGEIGWLVEPTATGPREALVTHLALLWLVTLVTATASAVSEREILRRRYDLEALARMSHAVERTRDRHEVARTLVDDVAAAFAPRCVAVACLRDGSADLLASHGPVGAPSPAPVTGLLAAATRDRRTLLVAGLSPDDAWLAALFPVGGWLILVPLVADNAVNGVLIVDYPQRAAVRLERRVVTTIERFAAQGALALSNAHLHASLVAMTLTDPLTRVPNRLGFDRALEAALYRLDRTGEPFALMLCDLDYFKKINDQYGHQAGDDVLVSVAATLSQNCRALDVVARYGGEEFAVVMPGVDPREARIAAERLRCEVEAHAGVVPVTISAGLALVDVHTAAESVLGAADAALYHAKRAGRNRVTFSEVTRRPPALAAS
jgi:diguanylate cyclase (GGDEF)-like protein